MVLNQNLLSMGSKKQEFPLLTEMQSVILLYYHQNLTLTLNYFSLRSKLQLWKIIPHLTTLNKQPQHSHSTPPMNDNENESLVEQLNMAIANDNVDDLQEGPSAQSSLSGTELKEFFITYFKSTQSKGGTSNKRGRRVASIGESLTAQDVLERQKKREDEKRDTEIQKEMRKLET